MKSVIMFLAGIITCAAVISLASLLDASNTNDTSSHREWCERIYHQNVSCPEHGQAEIPQEVLDRQDAQHLEWCERIYHQNIGCPRHGQVEIPQQVLDRQEAEHLEWCERIGHGNVGCPEHDQEDSALTDSYPPDSVRYVDGVLIQSVEYGDGVTAITVPPTYAPAATLPNDD